MKKNWYLLKNRRYEGPFELADLNVRAQQGELSPDDYLVEESNFTKGQMIYQKASDLLPKTVFKNLLSAPEVQPLPKTKNVTPIKVESSLARPSTPKKHQEEISRVGEWFSGLRFANVAGFAVVVLAATWFFDQNNSEIPVARQPARYVDSKTPAAPKQQVQREIVQRDEAKSKDPEPPVERLMPSERPSARSRPATAGRNLRMATPRAAESIAPEILPEPGERDDDFDRGVASENNNYQDPYGEPDIAIDPYYDDDGMVEPAVIDVVEDEYY